MRVEGGGQREDRIMDDPLVFSVNNQCPYAAFTKWEQVEEEQIWEVRATVWNCCCTCFYEVDLKTDHDTILCGETLGVSYTPNSVSDEDK